MNPFQPSKRRRRETRLAPEALESRDLMTGGVGDTFAVIQGTVTKAGQAAAVQFTIDPTHFTLPKGKFMLGIDIANASGSTLKPQIASVNNPNGSVDPVVHAKYAPNLPSGSVAGGSQTTAVLAPVHFDHKNPSGSVTYTVNVRGLNHTTGGFLLGFYLPGDADGNGVVNPTDLTTVQSELGITASNSKYTFDADANRDGRISAVDINDTKQNMGVSTTVSPTVSATLDPANETLAGSRDVNVPYAHFTGAVTPGAAVKFQSNTAGSQPVVTTADAKGNYSLMVPLVAGNNTFNVTSLDSFHQSIQGTLAPVTYSPPSSNPAKKS